MAIKFTYFDFEGIGETVRLAFVLSGKEFEDERVSFEKWATMKPTAKFGHLPLMQIGDKTMAQSGAMLRMVGKTYGKSLYPQEGDAFIAVEEAIGLIEDFVKVWMPSMYMSLFPQAYGYDPEYNKTDEGKAAVKKMRETFLKDHLPGFMKHFSDMIEANNGFLCGDKPTIADCFLLPNLRKYTRGFLDYIPTDSLEGYPVITAYITRMMEIPAIKEWYAKAK